tara:strand:- start:1107 stop:2003 length:897 start_codon:yes stop_codon:yes gene_type:complete
MYKERKKIAKKTFGNFPFISVIFSVTLSLLLLGLFSFFLLSSFNVKNYLESNTEINIYLNKKISPSQIEQIKRTLYTKEYSLTNTESTLNYVSSEEAAKNFESEIGEDFVDFLGNNPLRDLIILKINSDYFDLERLNIIESDILKIPGVYQVEYSKELIDNINKNVANISFVFIGLFLILLIISVILINNTLKIALFSQRFLIRSMQLVGATANYILRPFIFRGMMYGFIAGIISSGMLYVIIEIADRRISNLELVISLEQLGVIFISLIFTGIIMVILSTYSAVSKYLNSTLDELYD